MGTVFGDEGMTAVVIDLIVHHGGLLQFSGESCQVKSALVEWAGCTEACFLALKLPTST
ncbi:hypothetical protein [Paeniglutamicibacter cryotolerans]|uniref:Uncharacterized protein n=1 Tax=Paeniglutamicibacter cryotolerans TaxID=670079 RepID=A0A839QKM0_9MICC|nr:hypothetical protein [Paeniglutamicibacter cryotolerans]MBB2994576.1 hypothetical protein [Paeniglutamicibacter cryotolerans]